MLITDLKSKVEWYCIKIPFILVWFSKLYIPYLQINSILEVKGVCEIVGCDFLLFSFSKITVFLCLFVLLLFYILEYRMVLTTFLLFLFSIFIFSVQESFGVSARTGVFTLILFAQFLAYLLKSINSSRDLYRDRIFFSIQVIVASYTLSAISKLIASDFSWFLEGKYMVLQVLKSNQMERLDGFLYQSQNIIDTKMLFILNHEFLISILLFFALLIEFFTFIGLVNKKYRIIWGLLLLGMHIGIYFLLEIAIASFVAPMILFMLNPFYNIVLLYNRIKETS